MIERALKVQVTKSKGDVISQKYVTPVKKTYDEWMKEYRLWSGKSTKRRGRRLIRRI